MKKTLTAVIITMLLAVVVMGFDASACEVGNFTANEPDETGYFHVERKAPAMSGSSTGSFQAQTGNGLCGSSAGAFEGEPTGYAVTETAAPEGYADAGSEFDTSIGTPIMAYDNFVIEILPCIYQLDIELFRVWEAGDADSTPFLVTRNLTSGVVTVYTATAAIA